jgi:hypothetical protein
MAAKKPPGKGLLEKRGRILRSLDAHLRYLTTVDTMTTWSPPERQERPPRPPDPDPYRQLPASHYYSPRERPELAHPSPGPEDMPEDAVKEWTAIDPFVRGGLSYRTQQALAYIETFRRQG